MLKNKLTEFTEYSKNFPSYFFFKKIKTKTDYVFYEPYELIKTK